MNPITDSSIYQIVKFNKEQLTRWRVYIIAEDSFCPFPDTVNIDQDILERVLHRASHVVATIKRSTPEEEREYLENRKRFLIKIESWLTLVKNSDLCKYGYFLERLIYETFYYFEFSLQTTFTAFATVSSVDESKISIPKNLNGLVSAKNRTRMSFAKWFAKILRHYEMNRKDLALCKLTEREINHLSVLWSRLNNVYSIELVEGQDLVDVYWSGIVGSCMAHDSHPGPLFYKHNDVKMVVAKNTEGEIEARALIWTTVDGKQYMDTAYPNDDSLACLSLANWAKLNVHYYRVGTPTDVHTGECQVNLTVRCRKLSDILPWLDSFTYYTVDPVDSDFILLCTDSRSVCYPRLTFHSLPRTVTGVGWLSTQCECSEPWLTCIHISLDGDSIDVSTLSGLTAESLAKLQYYWKCSEINDEPILVCENCDQECDELHSIVASRHTDRMFMEDWCTTCKSENSYFVESEGRHYSEEITAYCQDCEIRIPSEVLEAIYVRGNNSETLVCPNCINSYIYCEHKKEYYEKDDTENACETFCHTDEAASTR